MDNLVINDLKSWSKKYLIPIILGFLGMMLFSVCYHLYLDHATWHQILNNANQQQQQQQRQQRQPEQQK